MVQLDRLYARLPVPLQHLAVSMQGLRYRLRRTDDRLTRRHLEFLRVSERWSAAVFYEHQCRELRSLLAHAFDNVPHFRELRRMGYEPGDIQRPSDLARLPILEKSDVRGRESHFCDDRTRYPVVNTRYTSGTTGTPLCIYGTPESFALRWGHVARLRTWAGVPSPIRPRRAQFTGRDIVPPAQRGNRHVYWRHNWADRSLLMSSTHISPETAPYYAAALTRFRPDLIDGYPSAVSMIARIALAQDLSLPKPRAIITSAETLLPADKAVMEEAFGCKVYDQYAASEPSCFWSTCEAGSMHIHPEYGISEVVRPDGSPVAAGEEGDVVVTSFLHRIMPLVRYRLGDRAILAPGGERCDCGRAMPVVARVVGRIDDTLYVAERGFVGRLDPVFKGDMAILEAQIEQQSLDHIVVRLGSANGWKPEQEQELMRNLRAKLGSSVAISVEKCEAIPRNDNGKFRSVVSKVKDQYPLYRP